MATMAPILKPRASPVFVNEHALPVREAVLDVASEVERLLRHGRRLWVDSGHRWLTQAKQVKKQTPAVFCEVWRTSGRPHFAEATIWRASGSGRCAPCRLRRASGSRFSPAQAARCASRQNSSCSVSLAECTTPCSSRLCVVDAYISCAGPRLSSSVQSFADTFVCSFVNLFVKSNQM